MCEELRAAAQVVIVPVGEREDVRKSFVTGRARRAGRLRGLVEEGGTFGDEERKRSAVRERGAHTLGRGWGNDGGWQQARRRRELRSSRKHVGSGSRCVWVCSSWHADSQLRE